MGNAVYVESGSMAVDWADTIAQQLGGSRDEQHLMQAAAAVRARFQPMSVANSVLACLRDCI
jgi:hypothetical protein